MLSSELPLHPPHDTARHDAAVVLVASARRNEIAEAASTLRVLPFAGAMSGWHFTRDHLAQPGSVAPCASEYPPRGDIVLRRSGAWSVQRGHDLAEEIEGKSARSCRARTSSPTSSRGSAQRERAETATKCCSGQIQSICRIKRRPPGIV